MSYIENTLGPLVHMHTCTKFLVVVYLGVLINLIRYYLWLYLFPIPVDN